MLFIVDQCPSLRHIWGLDLLMLSPASIAAVQKHIQRNNRFIDVHDGMSGNRLVLEIHLMLSGYNNFRPNVSTENYYIDLSFN